MNTREQLLSSIADTIQDYRAGEIPKPTPEHVDRWVNQFDANVRVRILREMDHVLKQTYYSRNKVSNFLMGVFNLPKKDRCNSWRMKNFLRIQQRGDSQNEILELFDVVLEAKCGIKTTTCGTDGGAYVYIDDAMFTGNHVLADLRRWVTQTAPTSALVHVVMIVVYGSARNYVEKEITKVINQSRKNIEVKFWCVDVKDKTNWALWPTEFPKQNEQWEKYRQLPQKYPVKLRPVHKGTRSSLFSSEAGRQLLEREFTIAGARIFNLSTTKVENLRPLGFQNYGFGFGSTIIMFRNCPNSAPLALWASDHWYPLFPRIPNTPKIQRDMARIRAEGKG